MNYELIYKESEKLLKEEKELKLDLLTIEQIFNEQSEIFKKYGTKAAITDFAIVLGGYVDNAFFTDEGKLLSNRTGWYWTKTLYRHNNIDDAARLTTTVYNWNDVDKRYGGVRPTIPFSSISEIFTNKESINSLIEVEYGEYPQWICKKEIGEKLEELYKDDKLNETGKTYTTDSRKYDEYDKEFEPREHIEYEYEGNKYVRVKVNSCYNV